METTGEVDVDVKPVPSLFELSEKQIIDACDKGECEEDQLIQEAPLKTGEMAATPHVRS